MRCGLGCQRGCGGSWVRLIEFEQTRRRNKVDLQEPGEYWWITGVEVMGGSAVEVRSRVPGF
jgi:hypothetical protein